MTPPTATDTHSTPWPLSLWAVGGVVLLLSTSVARIGGRSMALDPHDLSLVHWGFGAVWLAFMLYTEAWRGFHKQFSPRVVQRALSLPKRPLLVLFAPLVAMGLIHATPKRRWVARGVVAGIVVLVVLVHYLPYPWRQLVDVGVTVGLAAGTASVVWFGVRAALGHPPGVDPEYPAPE